MERKRYVVMGAGQVGFQLAQSLSQEGHNVSVIELDSETCDRVEENLDVRVVPGNGAEVQVLEAAEVEHCDLFMAVSSREEANLAASLLAKRLGAKRCATRVETAAHEVGHRKLYEDVFDIDLLLSTQLLATTRILNRVRGHSTMAVEYFAGGKVQLRKISLDENSALTQKPLKEVELPEASLVVALYRGDELIIPSGDDRAQPGDKALIVGETETISRFERMVTAQPERIGSVVLAGGSPISVLVAQSLSVLNVDLRIIEKDRKRAQELAAQFPKIEVLQGDATDLALLKAERIDRAQFFVALSGHDETNLMANLLAQELGIPQVIALVHRAETSHLWRRLGLLKVLSPRALANERIHEYIDNDYNPNLVSLRRGAAQVVERRLHPASPAAGVTLAEISPPRGLIVGAVVRGTKVFVPHGKDRLEVGDTVILFVRKEELGTVQLLFPGRDQR
ncbi:MAG: Trk system potassium transporter TrkA [Acidobacteriota bacterium]|nr:Trk system potassium transporter TrkA [Acidobacteriota bacterium]